MLDRTRPSKSRTAAAVSSQEVSMPSIKPDLATYIVGWAILDPAPEVIERLKNTKAPRIHGGLHSDCVEHWHVA
jgi:hypothetical protein